MVSCFRNSAEVIDRPGVDNEEWADIDRFPEGDERLAIRVDLFKPAVGSRAIPAASLHSNNPSARPMAPEVIREPIRTGLIQKLIMD